MWAVCRTTTACVPMHRGVTSPTPAKPHPTWVCYVHWASTSHPEGLSKAIIRAGNQGRPPRFQCQPSRRAWAKTPSPRAAPEQRRGSVLMGTLLGIPRCHGVSPGLGSNQDGHVTSGVESHHGDIPMAVPWPLGSAQGAHIEGRAVDVWEGSCEGFCPLMLAWMGSAWGRHAWNRRRSR